MLPENQERFTDKRYATRYEPTRRDACLSWEDVNAQAESAVEADPIDCEPSAAQEGHRAFALLVDISHTGASIALDYVPTPENRLWLRLEGESLTDWSEAEVVGVTTTLRGPHLVRLAFRVPCPFETLRAAVCG